MSRPMKLAALLPDVAGVPADLEVSGLVMDSREIRPGDAFIAIAGFGAHGLGFVEQARERGAVAIVFEPPAPAGLGWQKAGPASLPFMPPNAAVKPDEAAKLAKWILSQK